MPLMRHQTTTTAGTHLFSAPLQASSIIAAGNIPDFLGHLVTAGAEALGTTYASGRAFDFNWDSFMADSGQELFPGQFRTTECLALVWWAFVEGRRKS
jgi:hypothetical protein